EDRGRQHSSRTAVTDPLDQMIEVTDTTRGDDRDRDPFGNRASQRYIETLSRAVAIHRGQKDFAGAQRYHLLRILHRVNAGRVTAAMGEDLPAIRAARTFDALGIDRNHDALVAEFLGGFLDELAVVHRRGVD